MQLRIRVRSLRKYPYDAGEYVRAWIGAFGDDDIEHFSAFRASDPLRTEVQKTHRNEPVIADGCGPDGLPQKLQKTDVPVPMIVSFSIVLPPIRLIFPQGLQK